MISQQTRRCPRVRELHTEYGALRMSGERHKATRIIRFSGDLRSRVHPYLAKLTRDFVKGELLEKGRFSRGTVASFV